MEKVIAALLADLPSFYQFLVDREACGAFESCFRWCSWCTAQLYLRSLVCMTLLYGYVVLFMPCQHIVVVHATGGMCEQHAQEYTIRAGGATLSD
mmetsp:Transcript_37699/g.103581  ORF Transcript_37699/g.103581 Transcript_37699/m.103581 type:complete len:95 (+) Transcript_37699:285-569(+)